MLRRLTIAVTVLALAACRSPGTVRRPAPSTTSGPTRTTYAPVTQLGAGCRDVTYTPPNAPVRLGELCVPPAPHHRVGILLLHWGGGTSGDRHGMQAWSKRYLAAGYVSLSIDYALFETSSRGPVYPGPERSAKVGVQYLRRVAATLGIDPEAIVAHGSSAGARLGAQLLVTGDDPYYAGPGRWTGTADHINGLIAFAGPYDGNHEAPNYYGDPAADPAAPERRRGANSVAQAARASGPVSLWTSAGDTTVAPSQTTALADALRVAGKDVNLNIVAGAEHRFDHPDDAAGLSAPGEHAAAVILAWLQTRFPGT